MLAIEQALHSACITLGVGNDFFPGGSRGVDLVLELRGVSGGGGFLDPKIDQF